MSHQITPLFLFSLRRSGSTLCQRLLAADPNFSTAGEAHILLPFFYALKDQGMYAEFDQRVTSRAILDFCQQLPNQRDDYLAEIKKTTLGLYNKIGEGEARKGEARYFIDKTPLYHLIADDILGLFPEGKFIFVWRNPLSIASSIMETWRGGGWLLYLYEIDIYKGLSNLVKTFQAHKEQALAIRYEDLVLDPEKTLQSVYSYLDLPYLPDVLTKFQDVTFRSKIRDPNADLEGYQTIRREPIDKWKQTMANPLRKAWCRKYIRWIGRERLAVMGYDFDTLLEEINALPSGTRFLARDLYRIPYGKLYVLFEGRILKRQIQTLLRGEKVYIHD
jgi:hypothetical protein